MPDLEATIYPDTARVISDFRRIAREHGYALAVHGSLWEQRDIDLVAVPWIQRAHSRRTLLRALDELDYVYRSPRDDKPERGNKGAKKPHGRYSHVFNLRRRLEGTPYYVDLAVFPRRQDARP